MGLEFPGDIFGRFGLPTTYCRSSFAYGTELAKIESHYVELVRYLGSSSFINAPVCPDFA